MSGDRSRVTPVTPKIKMSKDKGSKGSRLSRYARAPIRVLSRARDFYVQSVTSCAGNIRYAGYNDTIALPTTASNSNFPRSLSVGNSSRSSFTDEDFRELMRVASLKTLQDKFGTTESPQQQMAIASKGMGMMPRSVSHSVAISRIDEDNPCDFSEDTKNLINTTNFLYPRSRSCAVVTKSPALISRA